ncbi:MULTISPECIES: DUF7694 domain-containing protein [unclassified Bradyrhizobium]
MWCRSQLCLSKQGERVRKQIAERLEAGRVRDGRFATAPGSGPSGLFYVQGPCGCQLKIIGFVRPGWEHVSVSTPRRSPNWDEMCLVQRSVLGSGGMRDAAASSSFAVCEQ